MKKISSMLFFFVLTAVFVSCEIPDYSDEIRKTYEEANRDRTPTPPEPEPPEKEEEKEESEPDNIIIDGNMWSKKSTEPLTWEEAFTYCENLTELGYNDWRLPTVDELRTLIQNCPNHESDGPCNMTDECLTNPNGCDYENCFCCGLAKDGFYDKLGDNSPLWSSLICKPNPILSWIVTFDFGCITTAPAGGCYDENGQCVFARCVR